MLWSHRFVLTSSLPIKLVAKHHRGDPTWTPSTKAKKMARKKKQ